METLKQTDTNSANDSKGRAFGFEGNNYLFPIFSLALSFVFALGLYYWLGVGALASGLTASPCFVLTTLYMVFLREGKPNGYAFDFLENLFFGASAKVAVVSQPQHPQTKEKGKK